MLTKKHVAAVRACYADHAPRGGWIDLQAFADHLHAGAGVDSAEDGSLTLHPCPAIGAAFSGRLAELDGEGILEILGDDAARVPNLERVAPELAARLREKGAVGR